MIQRLIHPFVFRQKFNSKYYSKLKFSEIFNSKKYSKLYFQKYSIQKNIQNFIYQKYSIQKIFIFEFPKKFNSKILFKTGFFPVFNSKKYSFNTKKEYLPGLVCKRCSVKHRDGKSVNNSTDEYLSPKK